ncbi:hypothetical protein EI555_013607 [Monodon monoceros]|uniref:G-protein coupled receptors family 1 profile domain-containing protein n=1 Tax=Monodon monoceros TaxID=40151 RepID=A0A4U1FRP6_MONMO|nr:hypothetical protein EI555_013607 [Monodon monoceros]
MMSGITFEAAHSSSQQGLGKVREKSCSLQRCPGPRVAAGEGHKSPGRKRRRDVDELVSYRERKSGDCMYPIMELNMKARITLSRPGSAFNSRLHLTPGCLPTPLRSPGTLEGGREVKGANSPWTGLIVVTLAVCWMPNQVRRIMAAAKPKHDWTKSYFQAYMILLPFSDTFFYLSSVVNPLLYNVSSQQFRSVFGQVLRCRLTLPHANQEKRLRAHVASAVDGARSARRPLIFLASRPNSSARRTNKAFLSTFQSEAKPEPKPQQLSCESPDPNSEVKPANPATENGFQEQEV